MDAKEWNPRYEAFARAKGFGDTQKFHETQTSTLEFTTWNRDQICAFAKDNPGHIAFGTLASEKAHAAYDAWLKEKYSANETEA